MKIIWLGHACFALESGDRRIITDPYRDVPGFGTLCAGADAVYCSHGHYDHAAVETVTLTGGAHPFEITELPCWHDEAGGIKRGENTIRVFAAEGLRVAHLGDLGHSLDEEQLAVLRGVDVLLLPVGGVYTIGPGEAKALADAVKPRVTVPMHYRSGELGFGNIADVEDFLALCDAAVIVRLNGSSFSPNEYPWGTVLLPQFRK